MALGVPAQLTYWIGTVSGRSQVLKFLRAVLDRVQRGTQPQRSHLTVGRWSWVCPRHRLKGELKSLMP